MVVMWDVRLPEFDKNRKIECQRALVFDQPCRYDMILGADFLPKVGIDFSYKKRLYGMVWEHTALLRDPLKFRCVPMIPGHLTKVTDQNFYVART
ncbi:hypothetical protein ACHAWF_001437 [Thalassiosira exigua]